jgi:hypothetical protein
MLRRAKKDSLKVVVDTGKAGAYQVWRLPESVSHASVVRVINLI